MGKRGRGGSWVIHIQGMSTITTHITVKFWVDIRVGISLWFSGLTDQSEF